MNGAIYFASRYGSTAEYAAWISEATGLPAFDVDDDPPDPSDYDFLVLGSAVIYYKIIIRNWVRKHLDSVIGRPTIVFTVSGAPAGAKLDGWIADSLPEALISNMDHVALQGRSIPKEQSWFDRMMLFIAAMKNRDPVARKDELEGFDYMDRSSIGPVVELVRRFRSTDGSAPPSVDGP